MTGSSFLSKASLVEDVSFHYSDQEIPGDASSAKADVVQPGQLWLVDLRSIRGNGKLIYRRVDKVNIDNTVTFYESDDAKFLYGPHNLKPYTWTMRNFRRRATLIDEIVNTSNPVSPEPILFSFEEVKEMFSLLERVINLANFSRCNQHMAEEIATLLNKRSPRIKQLARSIVRWHIAPEMSPEALATTFVAGLLPVEDLKPGSSTEQLRSIDGKMSPTAAALHELLALALQLTDEK